MSHQGHDNGDDDVWPVVNPAEEVRHKRRTRSSSDEESLEDLFARRESRSRARGVPDFVRRAIENTMESVQSTQNVSREAIQFFISTTDKTRKEIVRIAASEVGAFLRQSDIASEIVKVLTNVEADVHVRVKFKKTGNGVTPTVESGDTSDEELTDANTLTRDA